MKKTIIFFLMLITASLPSVSQTFRSWAETPPMGWNSFDCYGPTVTEDEVKANADYMAANLKQYGWQYIVVDIRWFVANTKSHGYNEKDPVYNMDMYGRYMPAENRFPSSALGKGFKPLADYIHSKGLKFGIHIMRGLPRQAYIRNTPIKGTDGITAKQIATPDGQCQWLHDNYTLLTSKPGAQEYYNSIIDLYASWGVDFIKVDDISHPIYHEDDVDMLRKAIDQAGRPIVLSVSPGDTPISAADHVDSHTNMWRMVGDVWDVWYDMQHLFDVASQWYPYIGDGTWPDCDMIPLGRLAIRGERGNDRMTSLTRDEQYSLMTFYAIMRSPLMFGGDMPSMDPFTLPLLTNKDVLRMHRESTGTHQLFKTDNTLAVTSTNPNNGDTYLALFNKGDSIAQTVSVSLKEIGLKGQHKVVDMWTGKPLRKVNKTFSKTLAPHASILVKLK